MDDKTAIVIFVLFLYVTAVLVIATVAIFLGVG